EGFDKTGKTLYLLDSRNRDTAALATASMVGKNVENKILADDPRSDAGQVLMHPTENRPQAVAFEYDRKNWKVLDKALEPDFAALRRVTDGDFDITSRTLDDKHWIVAYTMDAGPVRYYRYDRDGKKATFLFTNRKSLEGLTLARMKPAIVKSRDN